MQIKHIARILAVATALIGAQAHAAPVNLISDGGFDVGASLGAYNYANGFHGSMTGKGSPWTFIGGTGVANHASAWGGLATVETVAFIQNYNGFNPVVPTVSQSFNSSASSYTVTFDLAQRPGNHESVQVSLDGNILSGGVLTPADSNASHYSYTVSGLTGGSHTLQFKGVNNTSASDSTLFLNNVSVTAAVPEPETYAMMMAGLAMVGVVARRRKAQKAA